MCLDISYKLFNMKDTIIERLLDQGHITIEIADKILNNKSGKVDHISSLRHDGIISNSEALTLLRDNELPSFPFGIPNQTIPVMPLTYPYVPFNTPGTGIPTPPWTITCTSDLNTNFTDK